MPDQRLEDLVRTSLHAVADAAPFVADPRRVSTRARRRMVRTGFTATMLGIVALVILAAGVRSMGVTTTQPAGQPPFIPPPPAASVAFPTDEALVFAGYENGSPAVRYVSLTDSTEGTMALGGWPVAATPDGRTLLVYREGGGELVLARADGSLETVAVVERTSWRGATVAPDGHAVVYATAEGLFEVRAGGQPRLLLAPEVAGVLFSFPSWSPDGRMISFTKWDGSVDELAVLDLVTGRTIRGVYNTTFGTWSPDGSRLAGFGHDDNNASQLAHLSVIVGEKMTATEITARSGASAPVWSPDGTHLAFLSPDLNAIIISADGSDARTMNLPGIVKDSQLLWLPGAP